MTKGKERMSEQTIFKMQAAQRDFPLFFFFFSRAFSASLGLIVRY